MEDIRMMLDRRPLEPYWFFTWCISGPIITLVRHISKFVLKIKSLDCFLFINNPISCTNRRKLCIPSICQCNRLADGLFIDNIYSRYNDL
jgi:hypothetical protein